MNTRDTVLVALFAALIVAFGLAPPIPLAIVPVPVTLQTLGVMLAGAVLGPRRGALAPLLVIVLVALGLPVLSGGRGGLGVFIGPTAGFLLAWPVGAWVTGRAELTLAGPIGLGPAALLGALLGGVVCVYAGGIAWLALVTGLQWRAAALGSLAFIPGDLLKAVLVALAVPRLRAAYPAAFGWMPA